MYDSQDPKILTRVEGRHLTALATQEPLIYFKTVFSEVGIFWSMIRDIAYNFIFVYFCAFLYTSLGKIHLIIE